MAKLRFANNINSFLYDRKTHLMIWNLSFMLKYGHFVKNINIINITIRPLQLIYLKLALRKIRSYVR